MDECTCRVAYIHEVKADDLFTTGPASPEYRATGDARFTAPNRVWVDTDDELGFVNGVRYTFVVVATTCPHRCFGGYEPMEDTHHD
jgi:hypothetical protein